VLRTGPTVLLLAASNAHVLTPSAGAAQLTAEYTKMSTHSGEITRAAHPILPCRALCSSMLHLRVEIMYANAGRTLKEKQRKQYVERRLENIDKDACQLRLHLKRLG